MDDLKTIQPDSYTTVPTKDIYFGERNVFGAQVRSPDNQLLGTKASPLKVSLAAQLAAERLAGLQ
jgi:hypothetical protein